MKMYGLRNKNGRFAGFSFSSNSGDFCSDVKVRLDKFRSVDEPLWLVASKTVAEIAATTDTESYSSSYETPVNPFVDEWEVVEIELIVKG